MRKNSLYINSGAALATLLLVAPIAHAEEAVVQEEAPHLAGGLQLSLKLEPGLALALTDPQSRDTELGMGHTLKVLIGLNRYLSVGPSLAFTRLPATEPMTDSGTSWTFGAGGRLMRPHDASGYYGIAPWIDADLMYVRTGDLDRPGFAAGAGASMPLDDMRKFWIGPFVRYSQIIQGERAGYDNRDAKMLTFGIGLEITSGLERKRHFVAEVVTPPADPIAPPPPSDRDGDTVIDTSDNCPDVAGLVENGGCPPYEKVIVKREKLEVKEKIAFLWDSAKIEESSYSALNEVVRALQDNRGFKVQIDGHASSDGNDAHNQTLSRQRADAVLDFLVSHGVAKERLIAKGFSSSVPTGTNTTAAGRESNRRVEFIVEFIIVNEGNTP